MEIKGRVKAITGPVERVKKDGSGKYTIMEVDVQIGVYQRTKANYQSNTFETVDEPEMIRATYFGEEAVGKSELIAEGDVVNVKMHHYVNQYGRTETVIDSLVSCTAKEKAMQKAESQKPANDVQDELPF